MLRVLVDQAYNLSEPSPPTLFCLLEFDGMRLATSHVPVKNGKVKFNEEAEFNIKKAGNLRIQLCSVDSKPGLLSLEEHKLFGRTKVPIAFDKATETVQPVRELEIKSKSGKTRAVMNLRLTIQKNPNAAVAKEEESNNPFVSAAPAEKFSNPPTPTARNPFNRPKRDDSFRSSTTSVDSQSTSQNPFETSDNSSTNPFKGSNPNLASSKRSMFEKHKDFSQSLTSIDGIPEHSTPKKPPVIEEKPKERTRDKPSRNKSVRNTIIGNIGDWGSSSKKEEKTEKREDRSSSNNHLVVENDRLKFENKELKSIVKSKDKEIAELNDYIGKLLVRVMEQSPDILKS
ncbi:Oidioi.mRNA.OKI2018_I69.chr2.g6068.t2.cds [Oikopleura dioica]|uniref:Oidioi.mRNA.OKI2018_I69.chr2.g6068.t2.cds n=1 Tax=Oikopleura dioica TaxID=34765 RepID=A0ABN7T298_OIKDI|nr:Oidioi.mRNA.OKI2018_I69.chr2.g6068.t2.cds [Oikopleura dioica]